MTPQEVQEKLRLSQLKDKLWYVVPSCATTGEGLFDGLVRSDPTNKNTVSNTYARAGYRTISRLNRSGLGSSYRLGSLCSDVLINVLYTMMLIGYYRKGFEASTEAIPGCLWLLFSCLYPLFLTCHFSFVHCVTFAAS